jgi:hypothetical protein
MAGSNFYTKVNSTLWVAFTDESGYATHAKCTGTPPTTASLFLHGCQMIQTDTATGAKSLFENIGSTAVPEWNLMGDVTAGEITLATGSVLVGTAGVAAALDAKTSGRILVGNGTTLTSVAVSGDATLSAAGAVAIAAGAVTNAKVADSTGASALGIRKSATVVYDFAVDGGVAGNILLTGAPTIPDNAVVWLESYDVITTCTSATDAATLALGFPTDGVISTAVAISNGANPWDAGAYAMGAGGTATPLAKKLTAARVPGLLVAGGENLTAGKIVFQLAYWVSA